MKYTVQNEVTAQMYGWLARCLMLLRNMVGQLCLVTEKGEFVHQDCPEREKTIGIHSGYNKKPPLYGHKNVLKKVKKEV